MGTVDDLAAEAESSGGSFEFGGEEFNLPAKRDFRVLVALQRGNFAQAMRMLLGETQLHRFLEIDTDEVLDEAKLAEITERWMGGASGESSASSIS